MSFIRDEIYHTLSDKTYSRDIEAHGKFGPNRDWEAFIFWCFLWRICFSYRA
ncbi:hypothetical protein PAJ34TS1_07420 [Paenibacillus azoreducens]